MQLRNATMVGLAASPAPSNSPSVPYTTQPSSPLPACFNDSSGLDNQSMTHLQAAEERLAEQVKWAIMEVTVPLVCALGLVGNLLSLVVLTTEKLHRTLTKMEVSAHIGLIALAVSDFLFCLLVLVFTQLVTKVGFGVEIASNDEYIRDDRNSMRRIAIRTTNHSVLTKMGQH
ncbi:orphan G-protein coupled receptor 51 [Plakobranchus ocellatus]|uniref:Orphan G-protein coupled receptor 51 n=1 Tax=Plakobranchus ocellatus TaxID=259542 RepID=A0AAV3XYI6_9GAST|nr:orphan G-protein coupled receptor 51 [Plakobranchus ocellatus]